MYHILNDQRAGVTPTVGEYIISTNIKTLESEIIFKFDTNNTYHADFAIIGDSHIYLPSISDNTILLIDLETCSSAKLFQPTEFLNEIYS